MESREEAEKDGNRRKRHHVIKVAKQGSKLRKKKGKGKAKGKVKAPAKKR